MEGAFRDSALSSAAECIGRQQRRHSFSSIFRTAPLPCNKNISPPKYLPGNTPSMQLKDHPQGLSIGSKTGWTINHVRIWNIPQWDLWDVKKKRRFIVGFSSYGTIKQEQEVSLFQYVNKRTVCGECYSIFKRFFNLSLRQTKLGKKKIIFHHFSVYFLFTDIFWCLFISCLH